MSKYTTTYPCRREPDEAFTQDTLDRLTGMILSWKQGAGSFGALHLHSCWGEASVLTRRYQGQSVYMSYHLMSGAKKLYDASGELRWKILTDEIVLNLLALQTPDGPFIHSSGEHEPTYSAEHTCPIHQCLPILALLEYAEWEHAEERYKEAIRQAFVLHTGWMNSYLWRRGNNFRRTLPFPGWCGVTNQDLVVIAAYALFGKVYGDFSYYTEYGEPSLRVYLGDGYYYPDIGLMERGDKANFAERTTYYDTILTMLKIIFDCTGDTGMLDVADNIALHLFDALYRGPDGFLHMSWGAVTDERDKTKVSDWIRTPSTLGAYPMLLQHLQEYLKRYPDPKKQELVHELERTVAAYVYADGMIPGAIGSKDPIFALVSCPNSTALPFWVYLMDRLGDALRSPRVEPVPCMHRIFGGLVWKANNRLWSIERAGVRLFAGWKVHPHGIICGPEETIPDISLEELEQCDIREFVE